MLWSEYKDSNLGPPAPKAGALPGCATLRIVVPDVGIELTTYRLQGGCSTTELIRLNFTGGATGSRTQSPAFTGVRISNPLPYRSATAPVVWLHRLGSNQRPRD